MQVPDDFTGLLSVKGIMSKGLLARGTIGVG